MKSTFRILFYVKKDKQKLDGSYPIFCRITVDKVPTPFNTKLNVHLDIWDGKAAKAIGRTAEAIKVNSLLDEISASLH